MYLSSSFCGEALRRISNNVKERKPFKVGLPWITYLSISSGVCGKGIILSSCLQFSLRIQGCEECIFNKPTWEFQCTLKFEKYFQRDLELCHQTTLFANTIDEAEEREKEVRQLPVMQQELKDWYWRGPSPSTYSINFYFFASTFKFRYNQHVTLCKFKVYNMLT